MRVACEGLGGSRSHPLWELAFGKTLWGTRSSHSMPESKSEVSQHGHRHGHSSSFRNRAQHQNHSNLPCSSSQRESAVHLSEIGRSTKTIVICSVPAPREGLQFIIPKSDPARHVTFLQSPTQSQHQSLKR